MATHDYVIANASGAAVRADLNNALAAIVSNNSNATEPATTYAYMLWYDTTDNQLKQRNAANDGWIIIQDSAAFTIEADGDIGIGTTTPTRDFDLVRTASDAELRVESTNTGGDARLELIGDNTGQSQIRFGDQDSVSSSSITYSHSSNNLNFVTNGSLAATIDSSSRLLVGTNSDITSDANGTLVELVTANGGFIAAGRDDDTVSAGEAIGGIRFYGNEGGTYDQIGSISCAADSAHTSTSKSSRLSFFTTPAGTTTQQERLQIDRDGLLYSVPTYNNTTTSTTNYLRIGADGQIYRSTSSIAYKTDVEDMGDEYADAILNLRPVWYRSTCEGDNPNHSHWGFIAEEVEQIDPRLCSFKEYEATVDEEGNRVATPLDTPIVDGVDYASLTPLLLNLVKRQKAQIEALETRIAALEAN